jgi:hypothetical protein
MPITDEVEHDADSMHSVDKSQITWEIVHGRLHQNGIPVQDWQLTDDELKKWFPEKYAAKFGAQPDLCPLGCGKELQMHHKPGFIVHMKNKHAEFFTEHKEIFSENDMKKLFELIKAVWAAE